MDFGFDFIHQLAGTSKILDGIGIFLAEYLPYIILIAFLISLFRLKHWRERASVLLYAALSLLLASGIVKTIVNYLFPIDRPFIAKAFVPLVSHVADASFPSGHATFFFTLATVIFLQLSARWGIVAYIAALLMGIGRVFIGVHYPIDIVGGAVIGMIIPLVVRAFVPQLHISSIKNEAVTETAATAPSDGV